MSYKTKIICSGSFIDEPEKGILWLVETAVIRASMELFNASLELFSRLDEDDFDTIDDYLTERRNRDARMERWRRQLLEEAGIGWNPARGVVVKPVMSETFSVFRATLLHTEKGVKA